MNGIMLRFHRDIGHFEFMTFLLLLLLLLLSLRFFRHQIASVKVIRKRPTRCKQAIFEHIRCSETQLNIWGVSRGKQPNQHLNAD